MAYGGFVVFTDLSGTLLDNDNGSWGKAKSALNTLKEKNIPVVPCPSMTRAEIEKHMKAMELSGPFSAEDGSAVFIPEGYFQFGFEHAKKEGGYHVIEMGEPYTKMREILSSLKDLGEIIGFGDMSIDELAEELGLSVQDAELASKREYDEGFRFKGDEEALKKRLNDLGLRWSERGRYWHISKGGDKGRVVKALTGLYKTADPGLKTVGIGDSFRDIPMLKAVDIPILIRKNNGDLDPEAMKADIPNLRKSDAPGPEGWAEQIMKLLSEG